MAEVEAGQTRREEEPEGLSATFHEKAIRFGTMELRLLLPSAVAIAIVVAGALLFALRGLSWPDLGAGHNLQTRTLQTIPLPVAVFGGLALDVAWSFVLAGSLHAHLLLRVVGLVAYLFNGFTVLAAAALGSSVSVLSLPFVLASVLVVAIALWVTDRGNHRQAPHLHHRARLRIPTFAWVFGATTLVYALGAVGGLRQGDVAFFLTIQLLLLQAVLVPVLFLAGTDFAEWSEVVSGRLASLLQPRLPGWGMGLVAAAVGLAVLVWAGSLEGGAHRPDVGHVVLLAAPALLLLVPVCLVGWFAQRRPLGTRVPFWSLVLGVVFVFAFSGFGGLLQAGGGSLPGPLLGGTDLVVYQHRGPPAYSLSVPQGWARTPAPGGVSWTEPGSPSRLALVSVPGPPGGAATIERAGALAVGRPLEAGSPSRAGEWERWEVETRGLQGVAFQRHDGSRDWILLGLSPPGSDREALWDLVRESWTPGPPEPVENPVPDVATALPWIALGIAAMFALGLLLLARGGGEVATAGVFLACCALFQAAGTNLAGNLMTVLGVTPQPYLRTGSLAVGAAVATLVGLAVTGAVPRWRLPAPVLRLVLVLLLAMTGLVVLDEGVFETALERGQQFTAVQGVVLLAAVLWDVLMSGEAFTNHGGPHVPRHSRVLIYLGYTVFVVAAVVVSGSLGFQGGGDVGGFESDRWVEGGITGFGAPLLVTFFLVNLNAWRRSLPEEPGEIDQVDRSSLAEVAPTVD